MVKPELSSKDRCYQISIQGLLDERWTAWFNGVAISSQPVESDNPVTTLEVRVPDQARLRGILNKIWDLNLTLISVIGVTQFVE